MNLRGLGFAGALMSGTLLLIVLPLIASVYFLRFFLKVGARLEICFLSGISTIVTWGAIFYLYWNPLASVYVVAMPFLLVLFQIVLAVIVRKNMK